MVGDKEWFSIYFEQYKLYIESIEKNSDRRGVAFKNFVLIQSAIVVAIGFMLTNSKSHLFVEILFCVGVVTSFIFYFLLNSYKQLNFGKFELLHRVEERLPIELYREEWKILGEGNDWKKYFPFSHIELRVPFVYGLILIFAWVVFNYLN